MCVRVCGVVCGVVYFYCDVMWCSVLLFMYILTTPFLHTSTLSSSFIPHNISLSFSILHVRTIRSYLTRTGQGSKTRRPSPLLKGPSLQADMRSQMCWDRSVQCRVMYSLFVLWCLVV